MKILAFCAVLVCATSLFGADPQGFGLWKSTAIQHSAKELAGKIDNQKFAWQPLATYDNHLVGISHREADGSAELHETQTDIFIVEGGQATLIVGGTMVAPKTVQPHEIRGTSITGGSMHPLVPGDIVHIPAGVPHQLKIASGQKFTYAVIKIDAK